MVDELVTYRQLVRYDPTKTTLLRNAFSRDMRRRFAELAMVIKKAIVDNDVFGLKPKTHTLQMIVPPNEAFAFGRSSDKVEAFMAWLKQQVDRGILEVSTFQQVGSSVEAAWTNLYISDSYKRGVMRARSELVKSGYKVPTMDESGGIGVSMMTPFHIDRCGLIFTRVYSDLKGITAAMEMQIARVLAQGIADGDGMMLLARKLVSTINGTGMGELGITDTLGRFIPAARRAEMLARTEILRSYMSSTIQEYRNWGVEGVKVLAEWNTVHDDRVCEKCAAMDGKVFQLDEVEKIWPLHPMDRCIFLPYVEELQKYYKK
jgi:SPP1 gp7 family putative phage head morphogenesis protein